METMSQLGSAALLPSKQSLNWPDEALEYSQKVSKAYLALQLQMQRLYLDELLSIERLCIQLNVLQRDNTHLRKLKEMHLRHIRPLISRLQSPRSDVVRSELVWLVKMSKLLPPFLEDFNASIQALRQRSRTSMQHLVHERVTAAAA